MNQDEHKIMVRRMAALIAVASVLIAVYVLRLIFLQLVNGESFKAQATNTTDYNFTVTAARGDIVDSAGRRIAASTTSYNVVLSKLLMGDQDLDTMLQKVVDLLEAHGESWNDSLLIGAPDAAGHYSFTAQADSTSDQKALAAMKDSLGLQQYATADDVMEKLVEDYKLENYSLHWQRVLGGIHYEMQQQAVALGIEEETQEQEAAEGGRKLSVDEVRSLILLLLSIVLWFFGYNAVTSKYSVYASNILHKDYNLTLIIAQAAAIVSYLPVGFIASKAGRKKTILAGVVMLTTAFTVAAFLNAESPTMLMNAMFALAGIAWATINVNSFPMVVEMCSGGDVGKYTGFYYTASMAAQVATPMLSGLLMDRFGMHVLFPYAAVFTALAFVTMLFVRHGDSKPEAKRGLEALDEMED